jgi:hypothetical protein
MIARSGVNTRRACRDVGLIGSEAERVVRKLCDDRNIPRKRYFGGPYRLLTSPGYYSATIERERERRQVREETARRVGRWRSANAERQYELTAVAAAIIRGDIDRGTRCEKCGSSRYICAGPIKLQPLRVTWWCRRCSNKVRRMKGRAPS